MVKSVATALIGSYLMVWGIGQYLPGYPSNFNIQSVTKNPDANIEALGYLVGFVVFGIGGFIVQMKKFGNDEEEENEDDAYKYTEEYRNNCSF